jgi:dTDP-4-amino-4,6-dideoxygalactose transaminase
MAKLGFREWWAAGRAIAAGDLLRHSGPHQFTRKFEEKFAAYLGVRHVLAVTNGTAALTAALTAAGVGPGDEVLVPAYTWMATATAPVTVGAVPVLVDIDETLTIDIADLERKITPYTRAIIPVHMANLPANMDAIMAIAARHRLVVIEDACQAVGVRYKDRYCGAIGDLGAFSFNKYKNMNIGDGGAVATSDTNCFARALNFHDLGIWARDYGIDSNQPTFIGGNLKATEIEGAMLQVQLSRLVPMMKARKERCAILTEEIRKAGWLRISPHNDPDNAVALAVIFDTEKEAEAYAQRPGVRRPYDNSKHIYTNWEPVLSRRTAHPKMNPWAWAHRDITYDPDICAKSLDILRRTCLIGFSERWPPAMEKLRAKGFTRPPGTSGVGPVVKRLPPQA